VVHGYDAGWIRMLAAEKGAWATFRRALIATTRSASACISIEPGSGRAVLQQDQPLPPGCNALRQARR